MSIRLRSGQALVMVLLLLSVIITIGLAISSRSVTEVGISTTQEESARALAAAEAGIEAALSGTAAVGSIINVGTTGSYVVPAPSQYGAGTQVTFEEGVKAGEAVTVFLTDHDANGNLIPNGTDEYRGPNITICWGEVGQTPAIEVVGYYLTGTDFAASRNVYDDQRDRTPGAHRAEKTTTGCPSGKNYAYRRVVNLASSLVSGGLSLPSNIDPLFLRIRMLYNGDNSQSVAVVGDESDFPAQGRLVSSTGQAGQTSRRVQVIQRYPDPLPYLDDAVFSGGSLSK